MSAESTRPDQGLANQIRKELEDLKAVAAAFGPTRLRDGTWFAEFIRAMLASYSEEIIKKGGAAFFRQKYPGLPQDAIVDKLGDLAVKYAALAGGLSGFTSSVAVAATIGTAGGASVVTVPAAVATIGAEILYTTKLQVRLVYDISTVYGYPIELNDPEQLYRAFSLAYGVAAAAGKVGQTAKTFAPEVARAQLRGLMQGNTAAIQAVARQVLGPRIGRQITQEAILKAAVPVVGVAISSGWNYVATRQIAAVAKGELRLSAQARNAVKRLLAQYHLQTDDAPVLVQTLLAVITSDGRLDAREQEVHKFVMQELQVSPEAVAEIESQVALDPEAVERRLGEIESIELRQCLAELCQLAAVVSGDISPTEGELVRRFLLALKVPFDSAKLTAQATQYWRGETKLDQVARVAQQTATKAGHRLASAGKALGSATVGLFKHKTANAETVETSAAEGATTPVLDPKEVFRRLTVLYSGGLITDDEFEAQKTQLQGEAPPTTEPEPTTPAPIAPQVAPASEAQMLESTRLQALISLAKVDGSVDEAEKELLETFISQAILSDSDKGTLRAQLSGGEKPAPNFALYQGQIEAAISLVMDLVTVANINQKLHPAEKMYIRKVAEQLALSKEDVEEILAG